MEPTARHALDVAAVPAVRFNEPQAPRAWREAMRQADVAPSIRRRAWVVMSAALSWAARSQAIPEVQTNGCLLASERAANRRRSARRDGTDYAPAARRCPLAHWALSPQAVEAIHKQMLLRVESSEIRYSRIETRFVVSLHPPGRPHAMAGRAAKPGASTATMHSPSRTSANTSHGPPRSSGRAARAALLEQRANKQARSAEAGHDGIPQPLQGPRMVRPQATFGWVVEARITWASSAAEPSIPPGLAIKRALI